MRRPDHRLRHRWATTALELADAGVPVTLVTRGEKPQNSNTYMAQGGDLYVGKGDSAALLTEDLRRAGAGHCSPAAVSILPDEGPGAVRDILMKRAPVAFDRGQDGELSLALEGRHSLPRISQDMSALQQIMWNYVGLVRTTRRLARAVRQLRALESEIERFYRSQALTDDLIGLRNAVRAAIIVANAAWANRHSVGCHNRE